ncbi:Cyclin-dependent protein kinase inhibitor [Mycena kentingensis (nom. inval.)]|nr:Cyclin-dependent protein kinase inhibitor [Mycena kentingensis (nom. inval.)]
MEFFHDIGSDPLQPSLFELVAQEQLHHLLQPALKYVLGVFAQRYPRYLLRIVNKHEEFYAAIMFFVERHYLRKHNASFSENFYGLKRRRRPFIETERALAAVGGVPPGEKLRNGDLWRSLGFLVGIPYIRAKAQDYYEELGGGMAADVEQPRQSANEPYFRAFYKRMYPWLNTSFEVWLFAFNVAYLFGKTPYYRPWLSWMRIDMRRLGVDDFRAAAAANAAPSHRPKTLLKWLRLLIFSSPRVLLDSLRLLLPTAIFFIKFLEWWYSPNSPARSFSKSPLGPAVPPPRMLLPHPQDRDTMKFGKQFLAQQIPGWSSYYVDYKRLKKIISSLTQHRPASEAAALAVGLRPNDLLDSPATPPLFPRDDGESDSPAHKAAFFFKLERELEKINEFYLQKEAELKLRLETLLSKRRAAAMRGFPDADTTQSNVEWTAVEEGFRHLERDLNKLQQFVEINATAFRKILKKYDKRSKSTVKELYLARQVDVQPVFNRQLISELSDTVAACLLDLTDLSSGLKFEGPAATTDVVAQRIMNERPQHFGPFQDLENNLRKAVSSYDRPVIAECIHFSDVLSQQGTGGKANITRILWNAIIEAPPDLANLILASLSTPFDFQFIDDINGRTCLHGAAIAGAPRLVQMCIEKGVHVSKMDAYGRTALHYAAMNGHAEICRRLLQTDLSPDERDMDNYTPLVYATMKGSVDCVKVLLEDGKAKIEPSAPASDPIPLSLASRSGHLDVASLLLERGARCLPNTNGEFPMHLAAREGHVHVCRLLLHRDGWDTPDKYHEWTPLFHAARYGKTDCVRVLLDAGARVRATDELGHWAVYYAMWYGHHQCLSPLLNATPSVSVGSDPTKIVKDSPLSDMGMTESEIDLIPSLSLPPPIMPHRVYGHNYLNKNHLVQVTIGHMSRRNSDHPGVRLHHRLISPAFKNDMVIASTPLKLVVTTGSDANTNSGPYSVPLPLQQTDASLATYTFQIPSLDNLSLVFSIYPNFGTKTIGRAVALPALFRQFESNRPFSLPILDTRLHVIGEVEFEVNIITPFEGVTLEVGGDVETYWKSLAMPLTTTIIPHRGPRWAHRSNLIGSASTSPSNRSTTNSGMAASQASTISSLRGSYLYLVVQVTNDLHPVVFENALLPETGFHLAVSDVTLAQFEALALTSGRRLDANQATNKTDASEWTSTVPCSMVSLAELLKILPPTLGVCLELAYPQRSVRAQTAGYRLQLNAFVDSVLRAIFGPLPRRIVFTSFSPDVCSAVNWKQPNYPVFFASHCGRNHGQVDVKDWRTTSVGAAVEFARANNLLGIFVDADLLMQVPSLIDGIRNAGLLIGVIGASERTEPLTLGNSGIDGTPVDAFVRDKTVHYTDHSGRELISIL